MAAAAAAAAGYRGALVHSLALDELQVRSLLNVAYIVNLRQTGCISPHMLSFASNASF
jgi:hypothetical protein